MTSGVVQPVCLMAIMLVAVALPPAAVRAAFEDDPLFQPFTLRPVHGHAFVDGQYISDTRNRGSSVTTSSLFMQEGIQLQTGGSLYHPNFFDWNGMLRLGASQEVTSNDDDDRSSQGHILGYNFNGLFLRQKPVSLRVFSLYDQNRTTRDFAAPLEFETGRHGLELLHRGALNTSLLFEYRTDEESGPFRHIESQTWRALLKSQYHRPDVKLDLRYLYESIDETIGSGGGSTSLPTQLHEVELDNTLYFGDGPRRHLLVGQSRLSDRQGFFESQSMSTRQTLTLHHTPTFSTYYTGSYRQTTSEGQDDTILHGAIGFNKKVYESLDFGARAFIEHDSFTGGQEQRYGGDLSAQYRKRTPVGVYRSNLRFGRIFEQEESDQGERRIVGEPVILTDADFVPLNQLNVVPGSITVSNLDRTIIYTEGVHYNVQVTGPLTEIQRIEFGGDPIPDGATVLVDYTVIQAQDAQFTEDRLVWSHRLEIDRFHVAPYLILQYFNQDLVSGDDPGNLNRTTSITLGIDYNHDGLFASYEFETLDSQISLSYDAHRVRGSYHRTFGRDVTLTLGADAEWLTYTNADAFGLEPGEDFRNTYHAFGQFTQRINKSTLWRVRVDGRDISGRQTTRHAEISSGLEWQYRQLEFSIDGRYRFFEQEQTDGDVMGIEFKLKRYF